MKNKRNIFSEWINKIRNRNRVNEGIYYVSQRLRRTAKVVIPELNGLQDSINGVNANLQTLDNNAAKKNTANTFTQKQTFRNEVEFGTNIKMGYGAGVVNITPEDDSNKTLSIQRFDINMNNKKISNLANPTANNDAVNKGYVDNKSTEIANEINNIKQKNTEQDSEINAIKNINTTQTNDINAIKQKNTEQDNRITTLENKPSGGLTIYYDRILRIDTRNYNTESNLGELTIRQVLYTIKTDKYIVNMRGFGSNYFVVSFNLAYTNEYGDRYAICIARKTGTNLPDSIELNYDAVDYSRLTRQGEQ